jgi:hypothetical protein
LWNAGYWGPTVGYYGGINYGFGYFGTGFYGGYWGSGHFWYNRPYSNIGWRSGYVYSRSYNGFSGRPGGAGFAPAVTSTMAIADPLTSQATTLLFVLPTTEQATTAADTAAPHLRPAASAAMEAAIPARSMSGGGFHGGGGHR